MGAGPSRHTAPGASATDEDLLICQAAHMSLADVQEQPLLQRYAVLDRMRTKMLADQFREQAREFVSMAVHVSTAMGDTRAFRERLSRDSEVLEERARLVEDFYWHREDYLQAGAGDQRPDDIRSMLAVIGFGAEQQAAAQAPQPLSLEEARQQYDRYTR